MAQLPTVAARPISVERDQGPIRLAIFGAGKAARFHLDAIAHISGVKVVGVASRSGTTAEALAALHPGAIATAHSDSLIAADRVDAALVAVPTESSYSLTEAVLRAGIPVLVEKPAAPTAAMAQQLAELATRLGTLGVVAVNRRYYSLVLQALAAVRERGPVRGVLVEGHEPTDLLRRNGNIDDEAAQQWFLLNSIHFVDLLRLVGGEVESVDTVKTSVRVSSGDHVSASVRFANGAIGTYVAHWNSSAPPMLKIYGDDVVAEVRLSSPEDAFVEFFGKRRIRLKPDWSDQAAKPGVIDQDASFLSAVSRGRTTVPYPASDLADHARSIRLVESIFGPI